MEINKQPALYFSLIFSDSHITTLPKGASEAFLHRQSTSDLLELVALRILAVVSIPDLSS